MTGHTDDTLTRDSINLLLENGLADGLPRIAEMLMNAAMLLERSAHLQAAPGLRVTSKAFGVGRRMPIAQRFVG